MRRAAQFEAANSPGSRWNGRRVCFFGAGLALAVTLYLGSAAQAQSSTPPGQGNGNGGMQGIDSAGSGRGGFGRTNMGTLPNDNDDYDPMMAERRIRALNIERQKQMVSDAAKLLKLAQELNSEVAAANSGEFTPDQLRKIGEIEKLARNVRERMAAAVGEAPNVMSPPALVYPGH
jgi:hypothetical protein